MNQTPAAYPELTPGLRDRSLMGMLKLFGPGAIIASVTIGSGETVFASRGGAIFGYSLFWCFLVGSLLKGLQVYSGCRFITLTGRHPLESWMELPGPRGWFVIFISAMTIVWMPFWVGGGLPKMLGEFTNWVVGFPSQTNQEDFVFYGRLWGTFFVVVAVALTWLQSYGFLERVQTVLISMLLFCMVMAAVVSSPDLIAALTGTLVPTRPVYEPWLLEKFTEFRGRSPLVEVVTYLGALGGGTQDYLGYVGMLREKGWGLLGLGSGSDEAEPAPILETRENLERGLSWLRAPRIDVSVSFACIFVFTLCFGILGATVLYPRQLVPSGFDLLTMQSEYLIRPDQSHLVQTLMDFIYKTGIFFAFFGTIYGAYELYTRTTRECLVALLPRLKKVPLRTFRFWTLLWCVVPGLGLLWFLERDPVFIITPAALVGSALTCGLWCFAMLWTDRAHLPAELQMRPPLRIGILVAGIVLTVVPAIGIVRYVQDMMA